MVVTAKVGLKELGQGTVLIDPLHTASLKVDADGTIPVPEFAVYIQMRTEDANGTFPMYLEVRDETNSVVIPNGRSSEENITFESRYFPVMPFEHVFLMRGLILPSPGIYHLHIMLRHTSLNDMPHSAQPAILRIVPHEKTFEAMP